MDNPALMANVLCSGEEGDHWEGAVSLPSEANCLWRARRDCSLVLSNFIVISMWLALSELSAVTVCCGQEGL